MENNCVSVSEAARIKNVTRQALYLAIRLNRLKAYWDGDRLRIFKVDLEKYYNELFSRQRSLLNGEKIFDEEKGFISVEKASEMIGLPKQKLYYACRTGALKAVRKKASWVINVQDLMVYQKVLKKNLSKQK